MKSIVVRMDKPESCSKCFARFECEPIRNWLSDMRRVKPKPMGQDGCVILCELPEGHGRLVDWDATRDKFMDGVYEELVDDPDNCRANRIIELFDSAETVVTGD